MKKQSGVASILIHTAAIAAMLIAGAFHTPTQKSLYEVTHLDVRPVEKLYSPPPPASMRRPNPDAGGSGGGHREPLPVNRGQVARVAKAFVAPTPHTVEQPKIALPNGLEDMPAIAINIPTGLPNGVLGAPSAGPGNGKGPGKGCCGKSGDGEGNGVGDGIGPGPGPGVQSRLSAQPKLLWKIEPEYSEDARRARFQGSVWLALEVDAEGRPRRIRVLRGLGMGLDERAVDAVSQWKFKPGMLNGRAVSAPVTVEVAFRLL